MPDQPFRIILIVGFLFLIPMGAYHRLKAHTGEKLDRLQEGWVILIGLRLTGLLRMAGLVAFMIQPNWMAWSAVPLPVWLRWFGVGLALTAGAFLYWTMHCLASNLTDTVVTRKEHYLVTTGPYRWVRHPFYTSFIIIMIADTLVTANYFLALTGLAVLAFIWMRTRIEEDNLIKCYGDEYLAYMRKTGRFLPCVGSGG